MLAASSGACDGDPPPNKPLKFRVGGTISGLTGSITLQLNGTESLTRSENGPFTFQSELEDQSPFTVTIAQAPEAHDCALQDATGRVAGGDNSSVKVVCARRTYTLGGTVEGLNGTLQLRIEGGETLPVTANGPFTFQTRLPEGGTYAVSVAVHPRGHRCVLSNGNGTVAGDVTNLTVQCSPWFDLSSSQSATAVIGQQDFTSNLANQGSTTPGPNTLAGPWGSPVLVGGRLYVSDHNNRVLGFNGLPAQSGASAAFVLGQPGFTSSTGQSGQEGLSSPSGLSTDGVRLAVADSANNRILLFHTLPTSTEARPDLALGQNDFLGNTARCDASSLSYPDDVALSNGKLVVADTENHRVLIWNSIPTSGKTRADLVLGQSSFITCAGNDTNGDGTSESIPTASTLYFPGGVWTDGTRLLVADTSNFRVLLWNQFPTRNGQPADVVLGQQDFNTVVETTSRWSLRGPSKLTSTGQQIFVADHENNRVMVWNQFPITDGTEADVVLGQVDFTSRNTGDPDAGLSPSARSLYQPSGILLAPPYLGIADYGNNRVLIFESR